MTIFCPRCTRKIASVLEPGEPAPLFCMFCGQKLTESATANLSVGSRAKEQQTETQAFTPSDLPDASSLSDAASLPPELANSSTVTLTTVAGYRIVRFLGAGGMGTVYEAHAETTTKRVAVKILSPKLASNPSSVERFRQEGRVASQITHPRCVFVLQADTEDGRPYIIMELMPGRTLKDLVDERGPLDYHEAIDRILDVIDGLTEAHRLGVIHRDVKPSNCFLTDNDRVKVGDFGLSKSLLPTMDLSDDPNAKQLTQSGAFLGTIMYASPEQIRGEAVSYDSDLYSVCATLYFLLTGRAPFQHESLTASLAKAVSEPPPSIRARFPDVPRELERVVLRGLERDRSRRWQSLDELRDELVELQAEKQQPASVRSILLAYILDLVILQFVTTPIEILRQLLLGTSRGWDSFDVLAASWPSLLVMMTYFTVMEGLFGATLGKRMLRLAVVRLGGVGPPGLLRAGLRAFTFTLIWTLVYLGPEWTTNSLGVKLGVPLGLVVSVVCILLICYQFRKTTFGRRGIHDFVSQTRVIQRPRPPHRPRLLTRTTPPLERIVPLAKPLPDTLGGYTVLGKHADLPDGGEVWLGEDRALGRKVLLRLLPPGDADTAAAMIDTGRPTTLRVIGSGSFGEVIDGQLTRRTWLAYVAPAGAPLVDVVASGHTLGWIDARPILEELTEELLALEQTHETFPPTAIEQIWIEPNGRLQRLDFPLPTGRYGVAAPKVVAEDGQSLLRAAASLMLEGEARTNFKPIAAPIPPHANRLLRRLFVQDRAFHSLNQVKQALAENQHLAPQLTTATRAGHLGVLSLMVSTPLFMIFLFAEMVAFVPVLSTEAVSQGFVELRTGLKDEKMRVAIVEKTKSLLRDSGGRAESIELLLGAEQLPRTLEQLDAVIIQQQNSFEQAEQTLNRTERALVRWLIIQGRDSALERFGLEGLLARDLVRLLPKLQNPENNPFAMNNDSRRGFYIVMACLMAACVAGLALFAFLFRGGLSNRIAGLAIIRGDGRPANRLICLIREILVWTPILSFCYGSMLLHYFKPEWTFLRTGLWLLAVILLPLYVITALRGLSRPPQDRLLGTYLMPD